MHSTELLDPTPWLRGGELLLTTGLQLQGAKPQREFVERLAEREIAGLGFGTGFVHKKLPAGVLNTARKLGFPLFEVPYELPFIAITERVFAQLLDERYELLQRNMAGDVLAEALTGRLYPDELQARLRPFGIGESAAVLAFALREPGAAASTLEAILERAGRHSLVALRNGLLCAVVDCEAPASSEAGAASVSSRAPSALEEVLPQEEQRDPIELARHVRGELHARFGEVRAAASRPAATHNLRRSFHEARCALEAVRLSNGNAPEVASYRDLGAFQLLLSLQDDDALASYCHSVLGPVECDEGGYGDELLRSLGRLHRTERTLGAGRPGALLSSPHAALPHQARRAADRPRLLSRARPDRVLAGVARAGAGAVRPLRGPAPQPSAESSILVGGTVFKIDVRSRVDWRRSL